MGIEALDTAIQIFGTQEALATKLNMKSPSISEWRARGVVPANRCKEIEEATNGLVTRYDLRPDLFGPKPAGAFVDASEVAAAGADEAPELSEQRLAS